MLPGSNPGASKCPFLMPARLPNNNKLFFFPPALHFRNYCHLCTLQPLCALPALPPLPALGGKFVHLEPNHLELRVANCPPTKDCTAAMGYCMTTDYDTRVSVSPQPTQDGRWAIFVPASYKNMTLGEAELLAVRRSGVAIGQKNRLASHCALLDNWPSRSVLCALSQLMWAGSAVFLGRGSEGPPAH
jgi:hypothetical protein